jgi:hypothetical protein
MRHASLLVLAAAILSGCSSPSSPTQAPAPTSPTPSPTYVLAGTVLNAPPGTGPIVGATITVSQGGAAIKATSADSQGNYSVAGLAGQVQVTISAEEFTPVDASLSMNQNQSYSASLKPLVRRIDEVFVGAIAEKVQGCSRPCNVFSFPVYNAGTFEATLRWTNWERNAMFVGLFNDWVTVELWQGTSTLIGSATVDGDDTTIGTLLKDIPGGEQYYVRVLYYAYGIGRTVQFELRIQRPN